jgi:uncharacterized membrane protein YqiK
MDYGVNDSGGSDITFWLIIAGIVLFLLIFIGTIIAKLYVRAPKDVSFVRTGMGGQRVIKDGGALKIPIVQPSTACASTSPSSSTYASSPTRSRSPWPPRPWASARSKARS